MGAGQTLLTAIANDPGREMLSERRIIGFGRGGISISGRAPIIIRAQVAARDRGLRTMDPTGRGGGAMAIRCDIGFNAPAASTRLMQQAHVAVMPFTFGFGESSVVWRGSLPACRGARGIAPWTCPKL
jgi:phosphoheptose isomerase